MVSMLEGLMSSPSSWQSLDSGTRCLSEAIPSVQWLNHQWHLEGLSFHCPWQGYVPPAHQSSDPCMEISVEGHAEASYSIVSGDGGCVFVWRLIFWLNSRLFLLDHMHVLPTQNKNFFLKLKKNKRQYVTKTLSKTKRKHPCAILSKKKKHGLMRILERSNSNRNYTSPELFE